MHHIAPTLLPFVHLLENRAVAVATIVLCVAVVAEESLQRLARRQKDAKGTH